MNIDISEKVVVITGASKGIGRRLAIEFAKEKANVVINYFHSESSAKKLKKEIDTYNSNCILVKADVTKESDVSHLYNKTLECYGKIDVLIINAGICDDNFIQKMSVEQWQRVIDVNLTGAFLCSNYFSKAMIQQNSGKIIIISSLKGQEGCSKQINYSTSKAGLMGFAKALAKDLGRYNISVNVVCPGFITTDLNRCDETKENIAIKRSVLPINSMLENLANFTIFLSWEKTSGISGRIFNLDSRILDN